MFSEHPYSCRGIRLRSEVHRSHTSRCELVGVSTRIKDRSHDFSITSAACKMEWCVASDSCRRLYRGSSIKQELGQLEVIIESRPV